MKESFFFDAQASAKQKKEKTENVAPVSAQYHSEENQPMTHRDFFASMRANIQEKSAIDAKDNEVEQIKNIKELLSPELMLDYKQILLDFKKKAVKNEDHPQREFIDVENESIRQDIENYINQLILEVKIKNPDLNDNDVEELRMSCELFFDSMATVFNTRSMELDISDSLREQGFSNSDDKDDKSKVEEVGSKIREKYSLSQAESEILMALNLPKKDGDYNVRVLLGVLKDIWNDYDLGRNKKQMTKISAGYITSRILNGWAPSTISGLLKGGSFDLSVLLEYSAIQKTSDIIDAKTHQELNILMHDISVQINKRITDSLFYQEFEFIHEKKMGEIFSTLENGKRATLSLSENFIADFAPTCITIGSSLAFLAKINPFLGGIGLASLPVTYKIAKNQQEKMNGIYESEREKESSIRNQMNSVKNGFEDIRTSPYMADVAGMYGEKLNEKDGLTLERNNKAITARELFKLPYDATIIGTTIVSYMLQQRGDIPSGAIISNLMYSNMLQQPLHRMVDKYFNSFSYNVSDIQKMNKLFGSYERFDIPEGEKERSRIPVSELQSFDINIKGVSFKNILNNVNLEIKQGEFVTISGESGAGKTTLLRNLAGLYKPDRGSVEIGGKSIDGIKRYGNESLYSAMAYCNQNPIIFDDMTLRENLSLWTKDKPSDERVHEVLKRLNLDKFSENLDKEISFMSGGERVRIGFARMLLKDPKIILLDEPTSSLDSKSSAEVRKIIQELRENSPEITIVCVSHDQYLIEMGDRTIKIE